MSAPTARAEWNAGRSGLSFPAAWWDRRAAKAVSRMRGAVRRIRNPRSPLASATGGAAGAVLIIAMLTLTAVPSSARTPPTVLTLTPPWGAVGATGGGGGRIVQSGCQGNGSSVSIGSRPWVGLGTGLAKAGAAVVLVACGVNQTAGWTSYSGTVGISGIRFNVSTPGGYYVSIHLSGNASYAAAANLTTVTNVTPTGFAEIQLYAGMRIRDSSNSSWGHGSYQEHAKNCRSTLARYCQLVSAVVSLASTHRTNATFPVSGTLTWFSGPYQRLVPGDIYELGGTVRFNLFLTISSVAAGSTESAALAFKLHFTSVTVQGPF